MYDTVWFMNMKEKRCKHLMVEGTCSLCNGMPRSTDSEIGYFGDHFRGELRMSIPVNLLPYWSFDFEGRNTEDDAQEAAGSIL